MPYNKNKNASFNTSGGRKKKRGGAGGGGGGRGNKRRTDHSNSRQEEEPPINKDSDNVEADGHESEPPQDLDNHQVDECDKEADTVVEVLQVVEVPVVRHEENNNEVDCSETIDLPQITAGTSVDGSDGNRSGEVDELHADNRASAEEQLRISIDTPIKGSNQCQIEIQREAVTNSSSECAATAAAIGPRATTQVECQEEATVAYAELESENKNVEAGRNQWSIESILFNGLATDNKPIERIDTVDEHQQQPITVEQQQPRTGDSEQSEGGIETINYGPTGLQQQIEERTDWNSTIESAAEKEGSDCVLAKSIEPLRMGPEVEQSNKSPADTMPDHCTPAGSAATAGAPLSQSSSFSSNSSANTLSTIILAGAAAATTGVAGVGDHSFVVKEWDVSCPQSPILGCEPKSLRELALAYLNSLPYGHSIIEELAIVSERLKDLVLQAGTMDNIATAMRTIPPPVPPRRTKPVEEIKLDQKAAIVIDNNGENNKSRLLSIICDTSKTDITSGNDHHQPQQQHKAYPPTTKLSATHHQLTSDLIGSDCSWGGGALNHVNNVTVVVGGPPPPQLLLNGGSVPAKNHKLVNDIARPHQPQTTAAAAATTLRDDDDKNSAEELKRGNVRSKESLFINGDQGDQQQTIFKNTSTRDEVTNNNCKSTEDSHPLNEVIRELSARSHGGFSFSSSSSTSFTENLHHNHVIRPLSKEDKFCRGLSRSGSFKAPTLYEEDEEAATATTVDPSTVHSQMQRQLHSDMQKKRSTYYEQQSSAEFSSDKNVVPPPRRRSSLPKELHERQLAYLEELEKKMAEQQQFRPRPSVLGSRVLQEQLNEAETFRQQMHDEWRTRIAEREERRFSKVIKLTPIIAEGVLPADAHKPLFENSMEEEFLTRVQQRRKKLHLPADSDWDSGAESTPKEGAAKQPKVFNIPITVIEGEEKRTEVESLPKHLQEFAESYVAACPSAANGEGGKGNGGSTTTTVPITGGKWSPNSGNDADRNNMWSDMSQRRSGSVQHESRAAMSPVWTPRSAHNSPVASRKQFRPVQFQSPLPERKFTNLNGTGDAAGAPAPPPPWEQPGFDKLPPPVQHHHHQTPPDNTNKSSTLSSSSVRRLAQSFSAPKLNAGVLDGGHSEPYPKHSLNYVCPPTRSLFEEEIPRPPPQPPAQCPRPEDNKSNASGTREPVASRANYEQGQGIATGQTPKEQPRMMMMPRGGVDEAPISLRSEAKEHNQHNWYKQVYNTIHKPHGDDGFLTVRYKTRRGGGAIHKANGYMSEPEHGYESDYASVDAYSGITPHKPPGSYKMNPGKIENYVPGYMEPEKQRPLKPARHLYAQGNLSRALKEQGYESDNSLVVRKKTAVLDSPSPEYQKQAYLQVQAGGEPPLQGFRKQLPAKPKDKEPQSTNSPVSFDILDLVSPPIATSSAMSRDIICYPITNITRPLNLFGEFPTSKAFIPPTPPMRESSISNYFFNDMLLMSTDKMGAERSKKVDATSFSNGGSIKDQKNLANSSKLTGTGSGKTAKAAVHCKRNSRALSEPRRSTPSPVAFGRSISKERTFAEEKKRLEKISPQCKKANLTTRILKKGEYKSSEDLKKAIHKTVLGKNVPPQVTENKYVVTYQKRGDSQKWTSYQSANKCGKIDKNKRMCSSMTNCKQVTRSECTNSVSSLARTNSTYSIESTTKSCEPINCKFFGARQIVKLGAFVTNRKASEKPVKEKVRSAPKTVKGKCHPVTTYLSNKKPVTTSKFKIIDRNRSVSPVRSPKSVGLTVVQNQAVSYPKVRSVSLVGRSKSQPPKMVEIQMPDQPTVIHVKPERVIPCVQTYHSLPRMSRQLKSMRQVQRLTGFSSRTKSEGPLIEEMSGEEGVNDRWSVSTPSLNAIEKNPDFCSYRNSDRFLELNQFYSHLERVGELQKVTSQSDLRPIRKKEEVMDYDLWKKIRMRDKAQKELEFLLNQLKNTQKEKKFHFERDPESIRWNEENEPALRHKSMSVENLKEYFQDIGLLAEKVAVANEVDSVQAPLSVPKAIDSYENQLGLTISPKLMSTLSVDQVLKLKTQLRQIYSSEMSSGGEGQSSEGHKRSRSEDKQPTEIREKKTPQKFHTITKTHFTEQDKKNLTQSICTEIREAVEQRRRHKSLDTARSATTDQLSVPTQPEESVDSLQPKDIKGKITFFEKKPLEVPGTTIYHARDTSSDEELMSAPPQVHRPAVVEQPQLNRRSHSFSDLKELFGERNESYKCRSVSPSVRYAPLLVKPAERPATEALDHRDGNNKARHNSSSECTADEDQKKSIVICPPRLKIDQDVSWMAHKYETVGSVRGRCRKRRTVSGSSLRQEGRVLMPHIDIISKTAALQQPTTRICMPARPLKRTGEVEKIKTFFENKHKSSLLGEMFTSEPDIAKLRDVSVYLSGSWVAHQYPKKEDNFLSLPRTHSSSAAQTAKKKMKQERLRSLSISPSRKLSILKQCIFPFKIFDEEKLASPFPLNVAVDAANNTGRLFSAATEKDGTEKVVLRKHKDRRHINDEEEENGPPPPPPVKATKMHALDDQYNNNKYDDDTSRQYVDGNVNIHYKTPIRQEFKGIIPEDELAEQQADAMRVIYEQEKRRKQWQEVEDIQKRRHTDNFTPGQKSPISVHRFDDFVGVEGNGSRPKIATSLAKARALYDFVGQSSRELTFSKGDIITIHRKIDANWYEGEHNAFCGLFPVDYVEIISGSLQSPAGRAKPTEGLARAKYTFVAQSGIELSLNKGELVALTRQVDENWFEGRIANRKGIVPINYCEVITPLGKWVEPKSAVVTTRREELYIESVPERDVKTSKTEFLHVDTSSDPLLYRALFKYVPQNPDELEMFEGDTVMVLEKCDDGWFVGTSERTGCFGTFPGNYVQRI